MAELEVEEQCPTEANAIEHLGEDVHSPKPNASDDATQYSDDCDLTCSESHGLLHLHVEPTGRAALHPRKTSDGRNATLPTAPAHPTVTPRHPSSTRSKHMRNLLLSTAAVLMAGAVFAALRPVGSAAQGAAHNIVLVHGAFVDQTSWQPVADILTKKGYNVTLVENPLTSLAADVDATKQALAKQNGKTVLVGHSWGGVVIMEAGNDPKVSALVYVSAFAPDVGQSLATLAKSGPATEGGAAIQPDDKGDLYIDPKVFPSAVAADLPRRSPNLWRTISFR